MKTSTNHKQTQIWTKLTIVIL